MSEGIVGLDGQKIVKSSPKVVDVRPFGSMVLVEHLGADEILSTSIIVQKDAAVGSPQAYVVKLGDRLTADCGLKPGDRVVLQGSYVPVINFDGNTRERGLVELHNIKAILVEETSPCCGGTSCCG